MTKFRRSGILLWRNCNATFSRKSGSLSASDGVGATDSTSTLMSLPASAEHCFTPSRPRAICTPSSSFPTAATAVANRSGSVESSSGGCFVPADSQISKALILQSSLGRSLSSSSSSQPPPPLPPTPPYHRENPPDAENPDPVTLQEQWRYATRMYSKWYAHAWGTAILAGLSFYGLGWLIKGENPVQFGSREKKEEVLLKPE